MEAAWRLRKTWAIGDFRLRTREKLAAIRALGVAFPNDFKPKRLAAKLLRLHGEETNEQLEPQAIKVSIAGRLMLKRVMGKASFGTLPDASDEVELVSKVRRLRAHDA